MLSLSSGMKEESNIMQAASLLPAYSSALKMEATYFFPNVG
jgi:hypothetical protein